MLQSDKDLWDERPKIVDVVTARVNRVPDEVATQPARHAFVEQQPHATGLRGRRLTDECFARQLERGNCLFARHAWKIVEKLVERMPSLEIVDESLRWHACSHEDRRSAEYLGVAVNDGLPSRRHGDLDEANAPC